MKATLQRALVLGGLGLAAAFPRPSLANYMRNDEACLAVLKTLTSPSQKLNPQPAEEYADRNKDISKRGQPLEPIHFHDVVHALDEALVDQRSKPARGMIRSIGSGGSKSRIVTQDEGEGVGHFLDQAISAADDVDPDGHPRGILTTFRGNKRNYFRDDVSSNTKRLSVEKATEADPLYTLGKKDFKWLRLTKSLYGATGGSLVGGLAAGSSYLLGGDPVFWGASAYAATAGLTFMSMGIEGFGDKVPVLRGENTYSAFHDTLQRLGEHYSSVLLHHPAEQAHALLVNSPEEGLHVYAWYSPESGKRFPAPGPVPTPPPAPVVPAKPEDEIVPAEDPPPVLETRFELPERTAHQAEPESSAVEKDSPSHAETQTAVASTPLDPGVVLDRAKRLLKGYSPAPEPDLGFVHGPEAAQFAHLEKELHTHFIEREDLIRAGRLAALSDSHLLMVGPAGTAKSRFAHSFLSAFRDEQGNPSLFELPLNPETTISDIYGPYSPKALNRGIYRRQYKHGILGKEFAFLEEAFDAPVRVLRNLLVALSDRKHNGYTGPLKTVVAATNKYLPDLYERYGEDEPQALHDRFGQTIYVGSGFKKLKHTFDLFDAQGKPKLSGMPIQSLEALKAKVKEVQVPRSTRAGLIVLFNQMKRSTEEHQKRERERHQQDVENGERPDPLYRPSRNYTDRTRRNDLTMLMAHVLDRTLREEKGTPLRAELKDLEGLRSTFSVTGMEVDRAKNRREKSPSPSERSQLGSLITDNEFFTGHLDHLLATVKRAPAVRKIRDLKEAVDADPEKRIETIDTLTRQIQRLRRNQPADDLDPDHLDESGVTQIVALEQAQALLFELTKP